MDTQTTPRRKPNYLKFLFNSLFSLYMLHIVFGFSNKKNIPPEKVRFASMTMAKSYLDDLTSLTNFSHFIFQCVNVKKDAKRINYELVVYAYDTDGNRLNQLITLLEPASKPIPPSYDKDEDINLGSYKMTKDQYANIIKDIDLSKFVKLKFEPIKQASHPRHSIPNYVTYRVYPVDKDENELIAPTQINTPKNARIMAGDNNFLKPSPPAD